MARSGAAVRTVAITGAAGGIGGHVIEELEREYELTLIDLVADRDRSIVAVDVRDRETLVEVLRGCDAVVHLAALDLKIQDPSRIDREQADEIFIANLIGAWNTLSACAELGIAKVILMSSEACLGMEFLDCDPPPLYLPIDEAHRLRPSDAYGVSKQCIESIGHQSARRGDISVVCLRPTEVLFPDVAEHILGRQESERDVGSKVSTRTSVDPGGLAISRSYVRADDIARLVRLAIEAPTDSFEVFWAAADDSHSPYPTLELLADLYDELPEVRDPALYEADPRAGVFDLTAASKRLGWRPSGGGWDGAVEALGLVGDRR